jgi:hypothetical protein
LVASGASGWVWFSNCHEKHETTQKHQLAFYWSRSGLASLIFVSLGATKRQLLRALQRFRTVICTVHDRYSTQILEQEETEETEINGAEFDAKFVRPLSHALFPLFPSCSKTVAAANGCAVPIRGD